MGRRGPGRAGRGRVSGGQAMRGTVIKRGNGYSVILDLGRGPDGKRIRKWHPGYRTKRDAERARVKLLAELDNGGYVDPAKLTLAEYLERWLTYKAGRVEPETVDRYRELLESYV